MVYEGNGADRFFRTNRISIALALALVGQAVVGFVVLVQDHDAIAQLKADYAELASQTKKDRDDLMRRIELLDQTGSRAVQLAQQRMITLEGQNNAQESHLHDLDVKLSDLQRAATENKIWVDQLVAAVRAFSHNYLPPPRSDPTPDRFRMQGDSRPEGRK